MSEMQIKKQNHLPFYYYIARDEKMTNCWCENINHILEANFKMSKSFKLAQTF